MSTERQALPQSSPVRLYVIAGFPSPHDRQVVNELERQFPADKAQFVAVPAAKDSYRFYPDTGVQALLRATAGFAIRTRLSPSAVWKPIVPGRLILLYVNSLDETQLLSGFEHFAYAVPVAAPAHARAAPSDWRFDPRLALPAIIRSVRQLIEADEPQRKLARSDIRMLPPVNFHCPRGGRIGAAFRAVSRGEIDWATLEAGIPLHRFLYDDLPKVMKAGKKHARFYVDARGLVFPPAARSGDHGVPREISAKSPIPELQALLRCLYRFGSAIDYGFQHDVQLPRGKLLDRVPFDCSINGIIEVSGSHANIYPNDFVRPP
jgi:hypothetical protein